MSQYRWERRDAKLRKRRASMPVHGKSVFILERIETEKSRKIMDKKRQASREIKQIYIEEDE
jgi:hypothetical protein